MLCGEGLDLALEQVFLRGRRAAGPAGLLQGGQFIVVLVDEPGAALETPFIGVRDVAYSWMSWFICSCVRAEDLSSLTLSLKKATRSTVHGLR